MKKEEMLSLLLDLELEIVKKADELDKIFGTGEYLYGTASTLDDIIGDFIGLPKDGEVYCRDSFTDLMYEFGNGEISKEKVMNILLAQ